MAKKPKIYHYCPKCGEKITKLRGWVKVPCNVDVTLDRSDFNGTNDETDWDGAELQEEVSCPECEEEIDDPVSSTINYKKPEDFLAADQEFIKDMLGEKEK